MSARVEDHVLYCSAPDLRPLAVLLSTVHFSTRANITITSSGLHVEVEAGKTMQAQAFMEKDSFVEWSYNPPAPSSAHPQRNRTQFPSTHHLGQSDHESDIDLNEVDQEPEANLQDPDATQEDEATTSKFEVSLTSLLECLNVFGTASSNKSHTRSSPEPGQPDSHRYDDDLAERRRARLKDEKSKLKKQACSAIRVTYDGEGCPLVLLIEDSGVVTRCELVTYEAGELAEMDFPADRRVVHLILKSDWLRSAFALFDDKTASEITFIFSPPSTSNAKSAAPGANKRSRMAKKNSSVYNISSRPYFRLQVESSLGSSAIDFPNDKDILESFFCVLPTDVDEMEAEEFGSVRNS